MSSVASCFLPACGYIYGFVPVPTAPKWTGHHCEPFKKKGDHLASVRRAKPRQGEPVAVPENSAGHHTARLNKRKQPTNATYTIKLRAPSRSPQVGLDLCKVRKNPFRPNLAAPSPPPEDAATTGRRTSAALNSQDMRRQVPKALHHKQQASKGRISRNQAGLTVAPRATVLQPGFFIIRRIYSKLHRQIARRSTSPTSATSCRPDARKRSQQYSRHASAHEQ